MHKAYMIGTAERFRVDFRINWLTGIFSISVDHKAIFRRPFLLKIEHSFELGKNEKNIVSVYFNFFDYFRDVLQITVNGQKPTSSMEIHDSSERDETPVDDAAAAFLYIAVVNMIFSVIGTLFVPYLDSLNVRLMLLLGGMIYLLFAVQTMLSQGRSLVAGTLLFLADSAYQLAVNFSVGGLILRLIIFYYLTMGIREMRFRKAIGLK